jgi:catechol 2,3-dioxygenase-like lactoylglutathione lyase family enzyme
VTIDVSDLARGVAFWGGLLGLAETRRYGEYVWLGEIAPGLELILQQTADRKLNKNRVHFDIAGEPPAALEGRALELGAIVVEEVEDPAYALVVMADPDGNEFCIARRSSSSTAARLHREERR